MPKQIEVLTVADAARRLAITTRTVNRRAKAGDLPYVAKRPGRTGAYLFAEDTIAWAARASGVVPVGELATELHPGDPAGHGLEVLGTELFGIPDPEPDTGVLPLDVVALRQRARNGRGCPHPECVAAWAEAHADDPEREPVNGWYEI